MMSMGIRLQAAMLVMIALTVHYPRLWLRILFSANIGSFKPPDQYTFQALSQH